MALWNARRADVALPRVEPLAPTEEAWRDNQVALAAALVAGYLGVEVEQPTLGQLDDVLESWRNDATPPLDANDITLAIGCALGRLLEQSAGLDWVIATDEQGSDLALHGKVGDILIYPTGSVAKRIVAGDVRFVEWLHDSLVSHVSQVRESAAL
jgi:hypothetical protein